MKKFIENIPTFFKNPFNTYKNKYILRAIINQMQWKVVAILYIVHFVISYFLLFLAGDGITNSFVDFVYWYNVTLSTVGFGDLSPTTMLGKLITSFWVVVVGVGIFSVVLGQIIFLVIKINNDILRGKLVTFQNAERIVIFGNQKNSYEVISQIRQDKSQNESEISLVIKDNIDIQNNLFGVNIVKVNSFLDENLVNELVLHKSKSVLIDTGDDSVNISLSLIIQNILSDLPSSKAVPNVTAFFENSSTERIVERSCPDIECFSLSRNKVLATALTDAGTLKINEAINNASVGCATQYSMLIPKTNKDLVYNELKSKLDILLNITVIGIEVVTFEGKKIVELNPSRETKLKSNQRFFYIAAERLTEELVFQILK